MKQLRNVLGLAFVSLFCITGNLDALDECCFEVGASALWWKPCASSYSYASTFFDLSAADNFERARVRIVAPDYEWGYAFSVNTSASAILR